MRALLSMRLEKNFPTWYRELRPIYGAFEAGMDRFIDLTKNDFIGREAAMEEKRSGGKLRRVSMIVDAADADVLGDEPIWHKGKVVGWVTSGGYAHYVDKSMAQGYVPKELAGDTRKAPSKSKSSAKCARPRSSSNRRLILKARRCGAECDPFKTENGRVHPWPLFLPHTARP